MKRRVASILEKHKQALGRYLDQEKREFSGLLSVVIQRRRGKC